MQDSFSLDLKNRLQWALLSLRLGVFIVLIMWVLDKFVNPAHSAIILKVFYGIAETNNSIIYIIGGLQLLLILAFVTGIKKRFTYGLVFLMHAVSTILSYERYIDGLNNLLFFAAWPMLAACFVLYILREEDVKFTIK